MPIKQQPFWPGLGNAGNYRTQHVNHVLGFNLRNRERALNGVALVSLQFRKRSLVADALSA